MYDSSAKIPIGIEYGNKWQLGNFDECMAIGTVFKTGQLDIQPKYCLIDVDIELHQSKPSVRHHEVSKQLIVLILLL